MEDCDIAFLKFGNELTGTFFEGSSIFKNL